MAFYTGKCECGASVSGFDRAQTLKWKREHLADHKRPNWIAARLGSGNIVVEKVR
jgi:hypothetical protein